MASNQVSKQVAQRYIEEGIRIGQATGPDMDEALVRELTDKHRISCGVPAAVEFHVYNSPKEAMQAHAGTSVSNALWGQFDINWLQAHWVDRVELGRIAETESIIHLYELAKRVGLMWMSTTTTVVTRRPERLHMITKPTPDGGTIQVCHNPAGPAISYRGGKCDIYILNGLLIPKTEEWIFTDYDIQRVMKIKNTEVRSEALKLATPAGLEAALKTVTIDTLDLNPGGSYRLYTVEIGDRLRTCLRGNCPSSGKEFNEYVPPDITTVKSALNWREWGRIQVPGLAAGDYLMPQVRT